MNSPQASLPAAAVRPYPRRLEFEGQAVEIDELRAGDEADLLAFAQALPAHDLLFTYRDISQPRVIQAWLREAVEHRRMPSLVARMGGQIIGSTALIHDDLSWSPHVGELRVVVGPQARGLGLGRQLIQDCFAQALALGLEKLTAQMTTDQRGAITLFESLGFRPEALLAAHMRGRDGRTHDVVVLSHPVAEVAARLEAYGLSA